VTTKYNFTLLFTKIQPLRHNKNYLSALSTSFVDTVTINVRSLHTRFNTSCQIATLMLNCACTTPWSGVIRSATVVNIVHKCIKTTVSTTYNGEMTHRKQQKLLTVILL